MNRFEDSDILTKTAELLDLPMDFLGYGAGILLSWGVWKKWRENE